MSVGVRLVSYTVDGVRVVVASVRVSLSRRSVDEVFDLGRVKLRSGLGRPLGGSTSASGSTLCILSLLIA